MSRSFSVIIPTYNRAGLIPATIQSFLNQELAPLEIIVVDDGGSDNTEQVINAFNNPSIRYVYKKNEERGAARNFGAALAKGDYVTFFDSDDLVYPWYLSHASRHINELNGPECYAQHFDFCHGANNAVPPMDLNGDKVRNISEELIKNNFLACNGVFIRRDVFNRFKFSTNRELSGSEDWYLWLQLAANFPFYYSPVSCSCLVVHDERGEANIVSSKLVLRLNLLLHGIKTNPEIQKYKKNTYQRLLARTYLFASLKLADFNKYKWQSIRYMLGAIWFDPAILFKRNLYVVKWKLLFRWKINS